MAESKWHENVILIDADYLDRVAFHFIVNFERMLGRRIPKADLAAWLDAIALDAGLEPGDNAVQVVFLHSMDKSQLQNFRPADFEKELNAMAFKDAIGEFLLQSFATAGVVTTEKFFVQSMDLLANAPEVKRVMLIGNAEEHATEISKAAVALKQKDVTLFAMEPVAGRGFKQEILGFSLTYALGIRGDEMPA